MRTTQIAYEKLKELLETIGELCDVVVVEGIRDLESLRNIGFTGTVSLFSNVGVSDADFVDDLTTEYESVVILTDFDQEGREINRRLSRLLERRGVKVEKGFRSETGRLMAAIGVYTIESLDNVLSQLLESEEPKTL